MQVTLKDLQHLFKWERVFKTVKIDIDFMHKDANRMNAYDYCAVEDFDDYLKVLISSK